MEKTALEKRLALGELDPALKALYGPQWPQQARRCAGVLAEFEKTFACPAEALFSAPGRTEIGGNHTDHQQGRVLAAAVDLDALAAAAPNASGMIRIQSQGWPLVVVDLGELSPRPEEKNTSAALVRGVAARLAALGCQLEGVGLDAYIVSDVPGGSGLSSSAAFEVLVGTMLNHLFFGGRCSPVELAQIGQYAENVYFGKPCGLMDQTASSVGGVVAMDFQDPARPVVRRTALDLHAAGYALCILDSGADHGDLTAEYAAIAGEMGSVAAHLGKSVLREVAEEDFLAALPALRASCGDRAVLRAMHFFSDDRLAGAEAAALDRGDFSEFLRLVNLSGDSSALYLQNVVPTGQTDRQELLVTIALCRRILEGRGAVRVHGGGFGGTAQAFVPLDMLAEFQARTQDVLGRGSCRVLSFRNAGGVRLDGEGAT